MPVFVLPEGHVQLVKRTRELYKQHFEQEVVKINL